MEILSKMRLHGYCASRNKVQRVTTLCISSDLHMKCARKVKSERTYTDQIAYVVREDAIKENYFHTS